MSQIDKSWTDMAAETTAEVTTFAAADEVFALFAGAVYALHQDTLHACAIDMAKADDTAQAAAINAAQPTPLGDFAARVRLTMGALLQIESANRALLTAGKPPENDAQRVALLFSRVRLTAARLWLLTMQARAGDAGGAGLRVGVSGLWSRLQTVSREAVAERAVAFTGSYYNGVKSEPLDASAWPLSP